MWTPEKQTVDPVSLASSEGGNPPQPGPAAKPTDAHAEPAASPVPAPVENAEQYRCPAADTARGAWAPRPGGEPKYLRRSEPPARREGRPAWLYAALLLACWLPYLAAVWPGTVSNDSITQLAEIFGRKALSNGNPLFQTGLVWLAVQAGQTLVRLQDAEARAALVQARGALVEARERRTQQASVAAPVADEQVLQAEALWRMARLEHERARDLVAKGFYAQQKLDEAQRALDTAGSALSAARVQARSQQRGGVESQLSESRVEQAQAAERAAQARLDRLQL